MSMKSLYVLRVCRMRFKAINWLKSNTVSECSTASSDSSRYLLHPQLLHPQTHKSIDTSYLPRQPLSPPHPNQPHLNHNSITPQTPMTKILSQIRAASCLAAPGCLPEPYSVRSYCTIPTVSFISVPRSRELPVAP